MKKNSWIISTALSLLVLMLVGFVVMKNTYRHENKPARHADTPSWTDAVEAIRDNYRKAYEINNKTFSYAITDLQGNAINLSQKLTAQPKLVLRYSELSCNICVDTAIAYFSAFAEKAGKDNVILLVEFASEAYLAQFMRFNNINLPHIYRIITDANARDESPHLFVLDKSQVIKDAFYPMREVPALSEMYYEVIYKKYFDQSGKQLQ